MMRIAGMAAGSSAPSAAFAHSRPLALATFSVGWRSAMNQTRIIRITASVAAGSIPATNISPMETGTTDPRTSMAMDGGINSDMAVAAASTPAPSCGRYPLRTSCSRMIEPTATTSANFEPDTPATRKVVMMTTCSNPPRKWPTTAMANRTRRKLMPPCSMIRPAQMKKGMVNRTKRPAPSIVFCAAATIGATSVRVRYRIVPSSIENATGRPSRTTAKNAVNMSNRDQPLSGRSAGTDEIASTRASQRAHPNEGTQHCRRPVMQGQPLKREQDDERHADDKRHHDHAEVPLRHRQDRHEVDLEEVERNQHREQTDAEDHHVDASFDRAPEAGPERRVMNETAA